MKTACFALLCGTSMIVTMPAWAQDGTTSNQSQPEAVEAGAVDGGDIVVTARRKTERLQDVPVAVTAFNAASLTARSVDSLDQIARFTPSVRFDGAAALSGGNYNATVFIRGVGQNDFAIFSDPGVGFYVDDVYYARSIGGVLDAVDISSVQVLRGPQGTLFGKNTIGGAVVITTTRPDLDEIHAQAEIIGGSFNRIDGRGAVNIPLVAGKLALRVSGATIHRDGYVKRVVDGSDQGNRNANMIRGTLRFQPDPTVTIDVAADYTRAREHSAPSDLLAVANVPGISGQPFLARYNALVAPTLPFVAPNGVKTLNASYITASPFETFATGPNRNDLDLWGVQGNIAVELGRVTVKSITSYRDLSADFTRDGDNTPYTFRQTTNRDKQWQFSQELQLSGNVFDDRVKFVLGAFYFKEKASDIASADLAIGLSPPLVATPPFTPAVLPRNFTNNRSFAAYGQADIAVLPKLNLTLGGRYTDDRKVFRSVNISQVTGLTFIDVTRNATFRRFTPRIGLDFKFDRDRMVYASFSRGFKQGGFNGRPLASAAEVTRYEPELLDTYEGGIKSRWLDGALTANLAVFHSEYRNIQLTVNQTPQNFVANAAAGKIDGVELETVLQPASWFQTNLGIGYTHARYTSVGQGLGPTQILPITLNSKFVKTPEWTVAAGAEASHEFANGATARARIDYTMYSSIINDVANTPIITQGDYGLLNARASVTFAGNRLTLAVFGTNLTNTLYLVSGNVSGAFGLAEGSIGRPREYGASIAYRF